MFLSCEEKHWVPGSNEEYPVAQPLPPGPVSHWEKYQIVSQILWRFYVWMFSDISYSKEETELRHQCSFAMSENVHAQIWRGVDFQI